MSHPKDARYSEHSDSIKDVGVCLSSTLVSRVSAVAFNVFFTVEPGEINLALFLPPLQAQHLSRRYSSTREVTCQCDSPVLALTKALWVTASVRNKEQGEISSVFWHQSLCTPTTPLHLGTGHRKTVGTAARSLLRRGLEMACIVLFTVILGLVILVASLSRGTNTLGK